MIHPTAIVDKKAEIESNVSIGPYAVVGPDVSIGSGTVIGPHVVIEPYVTIGPDCKVFQYAAIGATPQSVRFEGGKTESRFAGRHKPDRYAVPSGLWELPMRWINPGLAPGASIITSR